MKRIIKGTWTLRPSDGPGQVSMKPLAILKHPFKTGWSIFSTEIIQEANSGHPTAHHFVFNQPTCEARSVPRTLLMTLPLLTTSSITTGEHIRCLKSMLAPMLQFRIPQPSNGTFMEWSHRSNHIPPITCQADERTCTCEELPFHSLSCPCHTIQAIWGTCTPAQPPLNSPPPLCRSSQLRKQPIHYADEFASKWRHEGGDVGCRNMNMYATSNLFVIYLKHSCTHNQV